MAMGNSSGLGVPPLVGAGHGIPVRLGEAPLGGGGGQRPVRLGVGLAGGPGMAMAMGGGPGVGVGGVKIEPADIKTETSFKPV